ncbi:MAG: hypothetical protein PHZ09_09200, partial [Eubacteriales bacterium]|nr:hypothetical protein [Eubacteriales bacterium]
ARWLKRVDAYRYFESVGSYLEISESGRNIVLCHYPMLEWKGSGRGSLPVFGHVHNNRSGENYKLISSRRNMLNAGTDINGYEPVGLRELIINNAVWKTDGEEIVKRAEMIAALLHHGRKDEAGMCFVA